MRDDQLRACAVLRTLRTAIADCNGAHKERLASYMIRLGRFLRDDPPSSGALQALRAQCEADENSLQRSTRTIERRCKVHGQRLRLLLTKLTPDARDLLLGDWGTGTGGEPPAFRQALRDVQADVSRELSLQEAELFRRNVVEPLRREFSAWAGTDPAVPKLLAEVTSLESTGKAARLLSEAEVVMKRFSIARLFERLQRFVDAWEGRVTGGSPVGTLMPDGLEQDLPALVDQIVVKLEEGIAAGYAIHRVRVLFEHFMRQSLRDELQREEERVPVAAKGGAKKASRARPQREQILQRHLDEFLFREGYFPVTHSAASGGYTDTLVLDRADSSGMPPLLVELKQAVDVLSPGRVVRAHVVAAINLGRGEVARYRGHLATRPRWHGLAPVVVVVHTCREDLSDLNAADVVVIDICDRPPSGKTPRR